MFHTWLQSAFDNKVCAEAACGEPLELHRLSQAARTRSADDAGRLKPAHQPGCQVQANLIDQSRSEECGIEVAAAFHNDLGQPALPQSCEQRP